MSVDHYSLSSKTLTVMLPNLSKLCHILQKKIIFLDLETNGFFTSETGGITQIGLFIVESNNTQTLVSQYINPENKINPFAMKLCDFEDIAFHQCQSWANVYPIIGQYFLSPCLISGFNTDNFDLKMIHMQNARYSLNSIMYESFDVRKLYNTLNESNKGKLSELLIKYHLDKECKLIVDSTSHKADYDAVGSALLLEFLLTEYTSETIAILAKLITRPHLIDEWETGEKHSPLTQINTKNIKNTTKKTSIKYSEKDQFLNILNSITYSSESDILAHFKNNTELNNTWSESSISFKLRNLVADNKISMTQLENDASISFLINIGFPIINKIWENKEHKGKLKPLYLALIEHPECPKCFTYVQLSIYLNKYYASMKQGKIINKYDYDNLT